MANRQGHPSYSRAHPIYFGLILGCFLGIFVIIGSLANYFPVFRLELVKKIADVYIIANPNVDFIPVLTKICSGVFWAFCDGCLIGAAFFWLYQRLDEFIHS